MASGDETKMSEWRLGCYDGVRGGSEGRTEEKEENGESSKE